jgi:hypothetical protein
MLAYMRPVSQFVSRLLNEDIPNSELLAHVPVSDSIDSVGGRSTNDTPRHRQTSLNRTNCEGIFEVSCCRVLCTLLS